MRTKRLFDLAIAIPSALIWAPALLCASLLVLLMSGRPVYYRSNRLVRTNRVIKTVKFRTMVKNADKVANRNTVPVVGVRFLNLPPDSPLYTRPGRILERLGLTEIPQLLHVLSGKMSIVGNRPLPTNVMDLLREDFPFADDRFLTPAGVTGPVQLVGRDDLSDAERLQVEGSYCRAVLEGYRARLDFMILVYTVLIVLHLKKPMGYQGVLDFIEHHTRQPTVREQQELLASEQLRRADTA